VDRLFLLGTSASDLSVLTVASSLGGFFADLSLFLPLERARAFFSFFLCGCLATLVFFQWAPQRVHCTSLQSSCTPFRSPNSVCVQRPTGCHLSCLLRMSFIPPPTLPAARHDLPGMVPRKASSCQPHEFRDADRSFFREVTFSLDCHVVPPRITMKSSTSESKECRESFPLYSFGTMSRLSSRPHRPSPPFPFLSRL